MNRFSMLVFFFGVFSLALSSCKKEDRINKDCIKEQKEVIKTYNCDGGKIEEYLFNDEYVYLIYNGNCATSHVAHYIRNKDCDEIGYLGGIDGGNEINGEPFLTNATLIRIVWKD